VTLSVVIVNWNTRPLLVRCLNHLKGLKLPHDCEVFVVDNGSWDGSAEAVRGAFPQVKLLENNRNLGFAKANNQALRRCAGQYVLLLNPDCYPEEQAVQILLRALVDDPKVGIAGGALIHPNGRPQNAFGAAPTLATELLPKGVLQILLPRRYPSKRMSPVKPLEVEAVLGAFLMVRREALVQVGGMDEGYFLFLEETDWCLRMLKKGWKVIHVPNARALHLQGQSAEQDLGRARVEFNRSRYRFFAIHRGRLSWMALRAGILLKCVLNWLSSGVMARFPLARRQHWARRHEVDRLLLSWQLRGCPAGWGLDSRSSSYHS